MNTLESLAELLRQRNAVAAKITRIIGRPAQIGHVGEFIASKVFNLEFSSSAVTKGMDGVFREGPLSGRSVNVKFYAKREGLIDIREGALPDYFLVLTGPNAAATSSRGETRPWLIDAAFLFDASRLVSALRRRGVRIGIATSVVKSLWEESEVYPRENCTRYRLSRMQKGMLALFAAERLLG